MANVTVTGKVEKADLVDRPPFRANRYSPGEQREFLLDVALRLDDGSAVYFKTPVARRTVAAAPGMAIVHYWVDGGAKDWMEEAGDRKIATPGISNDNRLVPKVAVGEVITVTGFLKAEKVSRVGNRYKVLNRVIRK